MKSIVNSISNYFGKVPDQLRKIKWLVLLFFIVATVVLFYGMTRMKYDFTVEGWFKHNDPTFVAYNEFHAQFGSEDGALIVYKPKDGNLFSAKSLQAVRGIREELLNYRSKLKEGEKSALEHVVRVNTLINASVLTVDGDRLLSKQLVGENVPSTQDSLDKIKKIALNQKDFLLQYFSKDLQCGAINIETDFGAVPFDSDEQTGKDLVIDDRKTPEADATKKYTPRFKPTDMKDYFALNTSIKNILEKPEYANQLEYYMVGNTADSENQVKMGKEMGMLYLAAIIIMVLLLWYLFRSFSGVVWPLLIVFLTTIWTIGIFGFLGLPASPFIILTVLLILTIGIADAVHIISGYIFFRKEGNDHKAAMHIVFKDAGIACLLTAFTNMFGMLALNICDLVHVKIFAFMSATGIAIALFLSLYLLPVLLDIWSPIPKSEKVKRKKTNLFSRITPPNIASILQKGLDSILQIVEKRPTVYIALFSIVFAISIFGIFKVKANFNLTDAYKETSRFYQSIKLIDNKMAGATRISLYLDLGKENALQNPRVLKIIDDLQRKFEQKYSKYVTRTSSIVDVVKDAYKKLNEGRADKYVIPADSKELSQTLFMFNTADPEERERLVDESYRKANITINLRSYGSFEYNEVFSQMQKDIYQAVDEIKQNYPDAWISITGMFALGMKTASFLISNELQSFGAALVIISIVILLVFGSLKAGLVSLIPNLIPSFLPLGLMGLLGVPLDFYTMMLAPILIGISVDDTIHFVTLYRHEVMQDGNIRRALKRTMKECGQAVVFTALVLGLGFGIMSISSTPGFANFGKFGAIAVFSGVVNDLFLLPALILMFKVTFRKKSNDISQKKNEEKELVFANAN